jgi:acetyl esterase/lipase
MNPAIRAYLRDLGNELSPQMIQSTQRFFAERFVGINPDTAIGRDHAYGPDERHRLDVFTSASAKTSGAAAAAAGLRPVLVFVHGGGFVMGDKRMPDMPFYDNVGHFAVSSGYVGVTMTYRLAPAHPWPAGSEDVAAAVRWLKANIAGYGGDSRRIFLVGQSAGAAHVAGYVAQPRFHLQEGVGIAGALLLSGIYDIAQADPNPFQQAYYGEARTNWSQFSTLEGLLATQLPLLFTVSEFDGADFQRQAALLVGGFARVQARFPRLHWLAGHNHISPVLGFGTPADSLGALVQSFIATVMM